MELLLKDCILTTCLSGATHSVDQNFFKHSASHHAIAADFVDRCTHVLDSQEAASMAALTAREKAIR